ncbi:MAG: hypothetical protein SFU98_18950 [Leptospiraceae bacterium]|nr:hypothetical protein [Leptospiraceae bacterium]
MKKRLSILLLALLFCSKSDQFCEDDCTRKALVCFQAISQNNNQSNLGYLLCDDYRKTCLKSCLGTSSNSTTGK